MLYQTFIVSAFNYNPLIWMFCGKETNNLVDTTHKRGLRAVINDFEPSFENLCKLFKIKTFHERNLALLLVEVYKSTNCLNPEFMREMFVKKSCNYNSRYGETFLVPSVKTSKGANSVIFRAILAWNHLPKYIKEVGSVSVFKEFINESN